MNREIIIVLKVLRDKLSEEGADALIQLINKANEKVKEDVIVIVEEKFERRLSEELGKLRVEIAETKSTMIKWMFIFWVSQLMAIIGVLISVIFKG